jgi:hypothetical protein
VWVTSGDQLTAKGRDRGRKRRVPLSRLFARQSDLKPRSNAYIRNAEIRLASEAAALSARRRELARKRAEYERAIAKAVRMIAEAERVEADARARIAANELAADTRARRSGATELSPGE